MEVRVVWSLCLVLVANISYKQNFHFDGAIPLFVFVYMF